MGFKEKAGIEVGVEDGNKLIAKFMGEESKKMNLRTTKNYGETWEQHYFPFEYHSSWDWLMPVVKKIEAIQDEHNGQFSVHIYGNVCTIEGSKFNSATADGMNVYISTSILDTKIESTWYNVVQFIKWHNSK